MNYKQRITEIFLYSYTPSLTLFYRNVKPRNRVQIQTLDSFADTFHKPFVFAAGAKYSDAIIKLQATKV